MGLDLDKNVSADKAQKGNVHSSLFSQLSRADKEGSLIECKGLTSAIYSGRDLKREINSVGEQCLGDTIWIRDATTTELWGFGVAHFGPASEAGSVSCYIKFGAVRLGENS